MTKMKVLIIERPDHWEVIWPDSTKISPTACAALASVQAVGHEMAANGGTSSMITIEWCLASRAGRWIVSALQ